VALVFPETLAVVVLSDFALVLLTSWPHAVTASARLPMHNEHRMRFIITVPFIVLVRLDNFDMALIQRQRDKFSPFPLELNRQLVESLRLVRNEFGSLQNRHVVLKASLPFVLRILFLTPLSVHAQARGPGDFQITKITKNLISAPQFAYTGAGQYQTNQRDRWLEVEVEFTAAPEWTDELTFRYYILFNGTLLTGEVTHTNVSAGRNKRSVMYVSPRTLMRFSNNRPLAVNSFQNIGVQIVQQGAIKDELSLTRSPAQWFANMPQISGFVLNKNETPFAPLYWDRYEQIKTAR
jgi:hypothetical protein